MIYNFDNAKDYELIGIGILNIVDSASLIKKCLYCEGEIDLGEKDYDICPFSKEGDLEKDLESETEKFIQILINGIENKTLEARVIRRNLDEILIPEETLINTETLINWLEKRSVNLGDLYYDSYQDFECELIIKIEDFVENQKNIKNIQANIKRLKN